MSESATLWIVFAALVAALLTIDLVASRRPDGQAEGRGAIRWTMLVIAVACIFAGLIWWRDDRARAVQFVTGYVVEMALSIDNLLVFLLVLRYFAVPRALQPIVLKWGIIGAVLMRGVVIAAGAFALREVAWIIYALGLLLVVTGARMLFAGDDAELDPGRNPLLRLARRVLPITHDFRGDAFVVHDGARWQATPLLLVVLVIEWTDLVFAGDSIPAIFGITRDSFVVYSSNIFAIIGLRALFFVLAAALARFVYLQRGVAVVLVLVGLKMLVARWVVITPLESLAGVIVVLGIAVAGSLARRRSG